MFKVFQGEIHNTDYFLKTSINNFCSNYIWKLIEKKKENILHQNFNKLNQNAK